MGLFRTAVAKDLDLAGLSVRAQSSPAPEVAGRMVLGEDAFVSMLYLERRRAERAQKRYVLMLLDVRDATADASKRQTLGKITETLCSITRETDIIGWYLEDHLIGVIGTEIGKASSEEIREKISGKFKSAFSAVLGPQKASLIFVSFHFFPEEKKNGDPDDCANITLYPDLSRKGTSRRLALGVKRAMDIIGSALALLLLSPLFGLIALAIKLNSKGPILFRQERLGQYGNKFRLLKFRSMRTDCDSRIHEEYVSRFIAGQVSSNQDNGQGSVFKLQKDPRVTSVGALLRKTSLDEFPQFWNVLVGHMSLVGPRPPLAYEFKVYDVWHRRRVLEIQPGITGLWQVEGRSRTQFDDMVRLDLKYARKWTIWLDLKILLQTPAAVVSGEGAH
jgi:lipopolysaccharide/colanic/teichoic acid biosynthesis glycosyltransferase